MILPAILIVRVEVTKARETARRIKQFEGPTFQVLEVAYEEESPVTTIYAWLRLGDRPTFDNLARRAKRLEGVSAAGGGVLNWQNFTAASRFSKN